MKIRVIVKGIISYIFAMGFAVIFGLFLDANVGFFILLMLLLAPLISVLSAWLSSRFISVSARMEGNLLSKGDTCRMTAGIKNNSLFPTPPILVNFTDEVGVKSESKGMLVSVLPGETKEFEVIFKAKLCGMSVAGIREIRVTDYLGLFSFAVKGSFLQKEIAVIPDIAQISAKDDNLIKVMQTSMHFCDSDDTVEVSAHVSGGLVGYDNRDYEPGDPLKRINWKLSAKRDRLLVRLEDEMASKSVNVVLDSAFYKREVDIVSAAGLLQYRQCTEKEIIPKIAEDAVENALGITGVLIRHNYTVNFYAMTDKGFSCHEIIDEADLEAVRMQLAYYRFYDSKDVARLPSDEGNFKEKAGVFVTPNSYGDTCAVIERGGALCTTVYAVLEEAKKQSHEDGTITLEEWEKKQNIKESIAEQMASFVKPLLLPYLLALLLSISVFGVFEVPVISFFTIVQMLSCALVISFCEYVNNHRFIGTLLSIVLVMADLYLAARLAFGGEGSLTYMHWFISGGESVESTPAYLLTLILIFTFFFTVVVYYFIRVRYRTSFLMLVSLLPFVIYVKVMQEVNMVQVVFVSMLNLLAFLLHVRTKGDKDKPITGYSAGLISLGMYATILIVTGLAAPKAQTRYYYLFERVFLGGNVGEEVPQEYSGMSEYSGNADGFNELNNRRLYQLTSVENGENLYLKRQTFDLYDFDNDRWYPLEYYSEAVYSREEWLAAYKNKSLSLLIEAMKRAQEYEPGILNQYGMKGLPDIQEDTEDTLYVKTMNFPSVAYITPPNTTGIMVSRSENDDRDHISVSRGAVFQRTEGFLYENVEYLVEYYDETALQNNWIAAGGANCDIETSLEMLTQIEAVLEEHKETEYARTIALYIAEAKQAQAYKETCAKNTQLIPESIKKLALEITKDCTYDWQKAEKIRNYFRKNGFVYDLSYDAPDDSVEYFLFEGKTGTCSDYASAFVLMARAAGLAVRYVEGFVPKEEYTGEYVVRTSCGHAYPEVYIQNIGYVVCEATLPAQYGETDRFGSGMMTYFVTVVIRVIMAITLVSAVIIAILFIHRVAAPYIRETYFLYKVNRASEAQAVVMLYKRIQQKYAKNISDAICTPYEYAEKFETVTKYDISELIYMVEKAVYAEANLNGKDKIRAKELYRGANEAVKEYKKKYF